MRSKDFLYKQNKRLALLTLQQNSALSIVNNTITQLQNNNEEIAAAKAEIQDYKAHLESREQELSDVQAKNLRIIENFKRLIEG